MGRRKIPRINFNLLAAAIIGLVVAAGLAFTAWRPESRMEALLQNLGRQVAAERWEQAEATLRTVEEEPASGLKSRSICPRFSNKSFT